MLYVWSYITHKIINVCFAVYLKHWNLYQNLITCPVVSSGRLFYTFIAKVKDKIQFQYISWFDIQLVYEMSNISKKVIWCFRRNSYPISNLVFKVSLFFFLCETFYPGWLKSCDKFWYWIIVLFSISFYLRKTKLIQWGKGC